MRYIEWKVSGSGCMIGYVDGFVTYVVSNATDTNTTACTVYSETTSKIEPVALFRLRKIK